MCIAMRDCPSRLIRGTNFFFVATVCPPSERPSVGAVGGEGMPGGAENIGGSADDSEKPGGGRMRDEGSCTMKGTHDLCQGTHD